MTSQLPRFWCLFLSCQQEKNTENWAAVMSLRSFLFRDDFRGEHIMPPPPRFSDLPTALTLSALRHCRHHQKLMIFPLAWYCTFSVDPYCSCQRELIDDLGNRLLQSNSGASLLYHQTRVCERMSCNESKIVYNYRYVPQNLIFFAKRQELFPKIFENSGFNLIWANYARSLQLILSLILHQTESSTQIWLQAIGLEAFQDKQLILI